MALPSSYLVTTKNLESFLNALTTAQAPERFTQKFLQDLDFKSTNDRLFIGLLKSLKFIDETGVPTDVYYRFLDQTQSKKVLAETIKDAYSDLFAVNVKAQNMTKEEVKNKFRTLTQGAKTDNVLDWMASTFKALSDYADWSLAKPEKKDENLSEIIPQIKEKTPSIESGGKDTTPQLPPKTPQFHYNIQIHLPESRDTAVYDAIFKSLKDHLF